MHDDLEDVLRVAAGASKEASEERLSTLVAAIDRLDGVAGLALPADVRDDLRWA